MSEQKRNPLVTLVKKSVGLPAGSSSCCGAPPAPAAADDPAAASPQVQVNDESAAGCCGRPEAIATVEGCCGRPEAIAPAAGKEAPAEPPAASSCCG